MENKKIVVAGNKNYGLTKEMFKLYPEAFYASRSTGYDLASKDGQIEFAELSTQFDIIVNCSALYKFNQTVLLDAIFKKCTEKSVNPHIICIGSTTDRVKGGKVWLYNAEKKALRDYCNSLGINGVWGEGPKVSLISFGSLSNVQDKHPNRKCIDIARAAQFIKWIVEQPKDICINEISIDPMQGKGWYE